MILVKIIFIFKNKFNYKNLFVSMVTNRKKFYIKENFNNINGMS